MGIGANKFKQESELSEKCLEVKNFKTQLNFDDPLIKANACYGFLEKKKKKGLIDSYQKRWLFIISSRPLNYRDYEENENNLDASALPWWLKFDTLYYYSFDDNNDISENKGLIELRYYFLIDIIIQLSLSNGAQIKEIEKTFCLEIDMGERKFIFTSEFKYELEKWCEALNISRKTTKEMKASISKKPKNIAKLLSIFEKEGEEKLKEVAIKRKEECVKYFSEM